MEYVFYVPCNDWWRWAVALCQPFISFLALTSEARNLTHTMYICIYVHTSNDSRTGSSSTAISSPWLQHASSPPAPNPQPILQHITYPYVLCMDVDILVGHVKFTRKIQNSLLGIYSASRLCTRLLTDSSPENASSARLLIMLHVLATVFVPCVLLLCCTRVRSSLA